MDLPDIDSVVSEEDSEEEIEVPFVYGIDDLQYRGITTFQTLASRRFTGNANFQLWHSEQEDIMVIKFVNCFLRKNNFSWKLFAEYCF
jgi:hypothetical protein